MLFFEWGVAVHDLDFEAIKAGEKPKQPGASDELKEIGKKGRRQIVKDYVVFPALSGREWKKTLLRQLHREPRPQRLVERDHLLRPLPRPGLHVHRGGGRGRDRAAAGTSASCIGAANIEGGPLFHLMSGNLGYQVEHHLYPDMPQLPLRADRAEGAEICERYGLPYNTGPFRKQWGTVQRTILRLAFPGGKQRPKPGPWQEPEHPVVDHAARNGNVDRTTAEGALAPFP